MAAYAYYVLHKPYGMLSQFTPEGDWDTLASLGIAEKDVYPLGRLDADSEGLLLLTNHSALNASLLHPNNHIAKTYWVQVEGEANKEALQKLAYGVDISLKSGIYRTKPCRVSLLTKEIAERNPPIRFRKSIPTTWLEIVIKEGKNRQVRKMTATVGLPALRLIRVAFGPVFLGDLVVGTYRKLSSFEVEEVCKRLII